MNALISGITEWILIKHFSGRLKMLKTFFLVKRIGGMGIAKFGAVLFQAGCPL